MLLVPVSSANTWTSALLFTPGVIETVPVICACVSAKLQFWLVPHVTFPPELVTGAIIVSKPDADMRIAYGLGEDGTKLNGCGIPLRPGVGYWPKTLVEVVATTTQSAGVGTVVQSVPLLEVSNSTVAPSIGTAGLIVQSSLMTPVSTPVFALLTVKFTMLLIPRCNGCGGLGEFGVTRS